MITVKAFYKDEKGLYCNPSGNRKFRYEIGKTYTHKIEKIKMCKYGFHASANCDISETIQYYGFSDVIYCFVDLNVIEKKDDKVVGDKITVLRELSIDECIKYDKTGIWCYLSAVTGKIKDIDRLQKEIIKKDKTGQWCYWFAKDVEGADISLLQKAVIKKDKTGEWCYRFANGIKISDINQLQEAVIRKDKTGKWCYKFATDVENANICKLKKAIKKKDITKSYIL